MKLVQRNAFTLVELMVAVAMLSIVIVGMAKLFIYTSVLADTTANSSIVIAEMQSKLEEIRNAEFDDIAVNYTDGTFAFEDVTGTGFISLSTANTELLLIEISGSWRNKYGRVIGEDQNLDGVLDLASEDSDGDGKVDSPVTITSMITRR
jgi:prepilin-type N-terminal cleavage/methylation domain-containing protein